MALTFFWHDYETFGVNPRRDRPSQFAGIRTDADLNEIGEPVMLYCRPADDYLPDPGACLLTGITPQTCLEHGVPEHEFAARIEHELAQPGTIGVGYNTIRFDDEVTRFLFWRNLIDPYAREWQNECSRWDLLDVVRLCRALRPEGIEWPMHREGEMKGKPSFKLEHLTAANGLSHEAAHDALSDVRATIALARLIRDKQPRLFDFALALRKKDAVAAELGLPTSQAQARPFLHVSGMFPAERGCLSLMWPLATHPTNKNELIAWDLSADPAELAHLTVDDIRLRLYTRTDDLPEGVSRLPIKSVHLNKSPMVVSNLKTLRPELAQRWGLDLDAALRNAAVARELPDMSALWPQVFQRPAQAGTPDVDEDLYGGFVGNEDRRRLARLRALPPQELATSRAGFDDARLGDILFRYRARNFPDTLNEDEQARWLAHRVARLVEGADGARNLDALFAELDRLGQDATEQGDERGEAILEALYAYAEQIAPEP
ncbi:exodeoxyribonuclease I [Hylemonella gracilis]|uniref:Exodeoxyribonuclease I n=1 Tax=Hylemonella gracilis ATCC 19624 TaxID=887062 RepID=F3KW97_9BURK|nr:exodeoxyribonuclease I [Hylemonella gracilis]EGI75970.1 exonuclease I [Hylemonella gracilis ATCC 19624]